MRLVDVVRVRAGRLVIVGEPGTEVACISGDCHSLFQVQGRAKLELRNVALKHEALPSVEAPDDLRPVGAAVFLLNRGSVLLDGCTISSLRGMGLWGVQRANISAKCCSIGPIGRSGVALFGKASAALVDCRLAVSSQATRRGLSFMSVF